VTTNVSALTSVFAATLGSPVIKVAAFTYGVRRALTDRNSAEIERRIKAAARAEKAARRSARRHRHTGGAA
jgi:hypothetical protein